MRNFLVIFCLFVVVVPMAVALLAKAFGGMYLMSELSLIVILAVVLLLILKKGRVV